MKFIGSGKVESSGGKVFDETDFAAEWHPCHPNDELPPMRPRSVAVMKAKSGVQ